jgi:hypothetical protein
MAIRPVDLPLLLAGPILRRVESDLVCVWIATSVRCNASLLLFDGPDVVASDTPQGDLRAGWLSQDQTTLQAGINLHVLSIVLDLRTPGGNAVRANGTLQPDRIYSYDIHLIPASAPTTSQTLRTLGLLNDPIPLGYDRGELPSFRTPPLERDKLVIVHGSCRQMFAVPPLGDDPALDDSPFRPPPDWPKAEPTIGSPVHGGDPIPFPVKDYPALPKRDGMIWVDALIDQRGPAPRFAGRPHQMFLTGDQIYADGVPTVFLPVVNHVGRVLIGDEDVGAHPADATVLKEATLRNFPPAFRMNTAQRSGGFTSDDDNHLFAYGEFLAHYLLAWSPSLWQLDLWPRDDVDPNKEFDGSSLLAPDDWRIAVTFADEITGELSGDFDELKSNLSEITPPVADPVQFYFEQKRDWYKSRFFSTALFEWWTRRFREGLPRVRRALANVPTYMIGDDHEVTDDLYTSRDWREKVFTRTLGVDVLRHGLMAYTLCQAWGNDPRRWSSGPERELLDAIGAFGLATRATRRTNFDRLHRLLGLPQRAPASGPLTFRPLVEYSYQVEGPCHRVFVIDGRTRRRFPNRYSPAGCTDYEGGDGLLPDGALPVGLPGEERTGFFGQSPMATALPAPRTDDTRLIIVVAGVPVLGPEGMELALLPVQKLARILTEVDAEAWSYEPGTYEALLAALARYQNVVILSGDIHLGYTAYLDYWSSPAGGPVKTARIVQLVSSGFTKDWGKYAPPLRYHALTHDIFESATTPTLAHAERLGWGEPFRQAPTPPPPVNNVVQLKPGAVAHPFYRARLKMRAPVVPTHGWPEGTIENREPNWAWRAFMARDDRPERTTTPDIDHRWTPVTRPNDVLLPESSGWHGRAALRMVFGRVFAINPNVGVVTFAKQGTEWKVRHVLAGEHFPVADTGTTPTGLQPYVVHTVPLTPPSLDTWTTTRPRLVADGGWGADETDPALKPLLSFLPTVWRVAAGFTSAVWDDIPAQVDDITREALLTDAADRVAKPFRRDVLRRLGPFALKTDAELDAISDSAALATVAARVGNFDIPKETRAIVRPDLERMFTYQQSIDHPATSIDDILLLACSPWVADRQPTLSSVIGILAALRSPITKHVPVLSGVIATLWDTWRNRTHAEDFGQGPLLGAVSGIPRVLFFALEILRTMIVDFVDNQPPRPNRTQPIVTPELALAGLGIYLATSDVDRRLIYVSGWDLDERMPAPGTRLDRGTPDAFARQTLSLLIHPGGTQRHKAPAQIVSLTMIQPTGPGTHGRLLVNWKGGIQLEGEIGGGVRQRVETDSAGFVQFPWAFQVPDAAGTPGATMTLSFLRPTRFEPLPGIEIRITPSIALVFGLKRTADTPKPTFELRLSLNDTEDRVAFVPSSGLLRQLLPTDGLRLPIDASVAWNTDRGWHFSGLGEIASPLAEEPRDPAADFDEPPMRSPADTEVLTPVNKKLGILTLHERRLEVRTTGNEDGATLSVAISGTLSLNLAAARISLSGLGIKTNLHLAASGEDLDDLFDLDCDGTLPTGLGVSFTGTTVSGGGFLERLVASDGRETWRGGLALRFADGLDVAAYGIVEIGGQRKWTLIVFVVVRFNPPVSLPWGLKLTAIGGLVALNRKVDFNALREAAMGSQGGLEAVLLPERPEERLLELLPAIDRFFPPADGHQVIGVLAEITWLADTGSTFGYFRGVLLGELEDFQFALYGIFRLGFPSIADDHILRIRAGVEALYDHRNSLARFSLTLTDALVLNRIRLTGGAALFFRWGAHDEFAFTVGGFHPAFRPFIPEGLTEPPRLGASWKPHSSVELSISGYFAVTSCSLQFGFSAHVEIGASWGGLRADTEFHFLVMTKPRCLFELELQFKVTAHLLGCDLFSASLHGLMTGPDPWTIEGSIYWEVCGVNFSKDFGPYHWGDDAGAIGNPSQEARQVLGDAFSDPSNWSLRRRPSQSVRLRPGSEDAFDPHDQLDVRQTQLPLGISLEVNDANTLADPGTWKLTPTGGLAKVSDLTDVFPTRRYLRKPAREVPFRGGLACGARFGGAGWQVPPNPVPSDESSTEDSIQDTLPVHQPTTGLPNRVQIEVAIQLSTPTSAVERRWTRHDVILEAIAR